MLGAKRLPPFLFPIEYPDKWSVLLRGPGQGAYIAIAVVLTWGSQGAYFAIAVVLTFFFRLLDTIMFGNMSKNL